MLDDSVEHIHTVSVHSRYGAMNKGCGEDINEESLESICCFIQTGNINSNPCMWSEKVMSWWTVYRIHFYDMNEQKKNHSIFEYFLGFLFNRKRASCLRHIKVDR